LVSQNGSKYLSLWESDDLVNWSEQRLIKFGDENFGCIWAPDILFEENTKEYIIHWSSSHSINNFGFKSIYYSKTKDFLNFTKPELLCSKEDSGIIDSAIYKENNKYYRFLKSEINLASVILEKGNSLTGKYERIKKFYNK
jgi:beta-xylosidase